MSKFRIELDLAYLTIAIAASSFIAGIEGVLLYGYFFMDFPYTFTGSLSADIMLFFFGLIAFVISMRQWWIYFIAIRAAKKAIDERGQQHSKDDQRS